jgi:hypothetical protein
MQALEAATPPFAFQTMTGLPAAKALTFVNYEIPAKITAGIDAREDIRHPPLCFCPVGSITATNKVLSTLASGAVPIDPR